MNGITRYDPFSETARSPMRARFDPFLDMDDIFNKFMMRPALREAAVIEPQIRMDVKEADGKYLVNAEIPGVNKDDIHVTIDGNRVFISAEVKQEKGAKEGEQMIRCERSYGMASRSFTLDDEVDEGQVQAKYNNGVLELTLPKKPGAVRKEIPIL